MSSRWKMTRIIGHCHKRVLLGTSCFFSWNNQHLNTSWAQKNNSERRFQKISKYVKLQCNDIRKRKIEVIENIDVVEVEYNTEEIMIDISYLVRLKAFFHFWIQFDVISLQCNIITYNAMYHILSQTATALADHLTSNVSMASFECHCVVVSHT